MGILLLIGVGVGTLFLFGRRTTAVKPAVDVATAEAALRDISDLDDDDLLFGGFGTAEFVQEKKPEAFDFLFDPSNFIEDTTR